YWDISPAVFRVPRRQGDSPLEARDRRRNDDSRLNLTGAKHQPIEIEFAEMACPDSLCASHFSPLQSRDQRVAKRCRVAAEQWRESELPARQSIAHEQKEPTSLVF